MKATWIPVLAIALGSAAGAAAQDMLEYSHVATKPPVGMQTLANKTNSALAKTVTANLLLQRPRRTRRLSPDKS